MKDLELSVHKGSTADRQLFRCQIGHLLPIEWPLPGNPKEEANGEKWRKAVVGSGRHAHAVQCRQEGCPQNIFRARLRPDQTLFPWKTY